MFKDNGRTIPAEKEELASIKGKLMFCPECNKQFTIGKVQFGSTICKICGEQLVDNDMATASKTTGK